MDWLSTATASIAVALEREFHIGRSYLMMGMTGFMLTMAFASPRMGSWLDAFSIKTLMLLGALSLGSGFLFLSFTSNIWLVALCYILFISFAALTLGPLSSATLLARWFNDGLGVALGISGVGSQAGGLVFPLLVATLIDACGWRMSLRLLGVLIAIFLPLLVYFTVKDSPAEARELIGDKRMADGKDSPAMNQNSLIRNQSFWIIALIISIGSAANTSILSNMALLSADAGIEKSDAATLISALALASFISSPLVGRMTDRVGVSKVAALLFLIMLISLPVFAFTQSYPLYLAVAASMGLALGGLQPLWGVLVAKISTRENFGRVMGSQAMVVFSAGALAPLLAGVIYDRFGTYQVIFAVLMGASLLGLLLVPRIASIEQ